MSAYIKGVSYYLPSKVVDNQDLATEFPEWNVDKIANKVGICSRHIAATTETAMDMAEEAARVLFKEYNIDKKEIDFIILCTQSPDYKLPTSACILQDRLGISTNCGALDINLGCSGYVYGLSLAKGLIYGNIAKNILLLTSETYNKYIHKSDKGNRSIFGDGASATLISNNGFAEIGDFVLGTDGRGADNLIVRSTGARIPSHVGDYDLDAGGYVKSSDYLYMNGSEIFNFTLETVPAMVDEVLKKNSLSINEVDRFIFHQANKMILTNLRKICGIEKDKFFIDLQDTGNTVSSTLPIAIKKAVLSNFIEKGHKAVLTGFGVGYSWGGVVLSF